MRKISEGAESSIYAARLLGLDCILKRRIEKSYRLKEIDEGLRVRRTRNEARIMGFVSSLGISAPLLLMVGRYDIYMSRLDGKNLNCVNLKDGRAIFSTIGSYAALLHDNDITHGDFTTANVMVNGNCISIIDFGLSEITNSMESKALDLLLMKRSASTTQFGILLESYMRKCKDSGAIVSRMKEIEKRGRYNTRTMLTRARS